MAEKTIVTDYFPSFLLVGMVVLLIAASFIPGKPAMMNGFICTGLFIIGLARTMLKTKCAKECRAALKEIDFFTILLLAGLFVVIGGITEAGIIEDISKMFVSIGGDSVFVTYTLIVWASVLLSAVIDNIPYVATMLPVAAGIANIMGIEPYLLYFGLLTGATLGGNMTPIGASANIAGIGILRKEGHEVSTRQFMRIGVPFTLAAVTSGYLIIWFLWR
jgi:Na+/H+ antiporter NhaD/arsenite permease-like protein